ELLAAAVLVLLAGFAAWRRRRMVNHYLGRRLSGGSRPTYEGQRFAGDERLLRGDADRAFPRRRSGPPCRAGAAAAGRHGHRPRRFPYLLACAANRGPP